MSATQYGGPGCTCRPFTRTDPPRYLKPGEPTDRTTSWQQAADCPHHVPGLNAAPPGPRQAAYDAVYRHIRNLGDRLPVDPVHRNASIWRAVEAALDAAGVPALQPALGDSGPSVQEAAADDARWWNAEREGA